MAPIILEQEDEIRWKSVLVILARANVPNTFYDTALKFSILQTANEFLRFSLTTSTLEVVSMLFNNVARLAGIQYVEYLKAMPI